MGNYSVFIAAFSHWNTIYIQEKRNSVKILIINIPPLPPVYLIGRMFSSLFHFIDVESRHSSNLRLSLFLNPCAHSLGKQTRIITRSSRKRQKWRHGVFSDEKHNRRGGRMRGHEIVLLLTSYIFIQDLWGNSSDYRLLWLPFCSCFVFSYNFDLFFLHVASPSYD